MTLSKSILIRAFIYSKKMFSLPTFKQICFEKNLKSNLLTVFLYNKFRFIPFPERNRLKLFWKQNKRATRFEEL